MNRRQFLKTTLAGAGALAAFPTIVPASALGRGGKVAPSNRIALAALGNGWMGAANVNGFLNLDDVQIVALCDIYKPHLESGRDVINNRYENKDVALYHDFREMLARPDLDAVTMALPDHWHAIPAILAAQQGLDVYGEKPLSRTVVEGRAIVNAMKTYGRIWQTGSWQRSRDNFRQACELVRNGRIGKVHHVDVGYGGGHPDFDGNGKKVDPETPPADLDYDMWLGPAPWQPFAPARVMKTWRWILDYGGGMLTDWVGHHVDIAHWGMDLDRTGPVTVDAKGTFEPGLWDTPATFDVNCTYANGLTLRISDKLGSGVRFHGENDKWVHVNRGSIEANPSSLLEERIGPEEIRLTQSQDHYRNFIDCVKSRATTLTPAETAHRSVTVGNLGLISILTGRKLQWDPETETIKDDPAASALLGRAMRGPWTLVV